MKNTLHDVYGYSCEEIDMKVEDTFRHLFEGQHRFFFDGIGETSYLMDTGNCDSRTEGISYGMMMCVLLDKKDYFDRLWKFAHTYMYLSESPMKGYFAWSVAPDGKKNAFGPAPDGEEFFAMALFLADKKWGSAEGLYNYRLWAREILSTALHSDFPMWTRDTHLIRFVPGAPFSDPSYHLPHFYRCFAECANECDRPFWREAEKASRAYLVKACHPKTGLCAEYAEFDGSPRTDEGHGDFYSDAYRTGANIGLDALWCGKTPELSAIADNLVRFFADVEPADYGRYSLDGTPTGEKALHPVGLLATLAQTTLACTDAAKEESEKIVRRFWNTPPRTGERRYYDNCLYLFALLSLSGKYTCA